MALPREPQGSLQLPNLIPSLLVMGASLFAQPQDGEPPQAFIEVRPVREDYFPGETIEVEVRFGLEVGFLEDQLVPLFRRELDLSLQVVAPWAGGGDCASPHLSKEAPQAAYTLVLNDGVARATREEQQRVDGSLFAVFLLHLTYRAECLGQLTLSPTRLRFAHAAAHEEDPFGTRVSLDRSLSELTANRAEVTIRDFPESNRPPEFSGAVGRFELRTELTGDTTSEFRFTLLVEGDGALAPEHFPRLVELSGFHIRGQSSRAVPGGLAYTIDLARVGPGARTLPPILFAYFEPAPAHAYRILRSAPVLLPGAGLPVALPAGAREDERTPESSRWMVVFPITAALLLWAFLRRKRSPAPETIPHPAREAARTFALGVEKGAELPHALESLLAQLAAAPIAPLSRHELRARLMACGLSPEIAEEALQLYERANQARYGSGAEILGRDEALAFAQRLLQEGP